MPMKVLGKTYLGKKREKEGEIMIYLGSGEEERSGSDWLIVP